MTPLRIVSAAAILAVALATSPSGFAQSIQGTVLEPEPSNLALTWDWASVVLPASLTQDGVWSGVMLRARVKNTMGRAPTAIVMHGSSGNAAAIKEYQRWLAEELGVASIAPDSLAIPNRLTYSSPIDKPTYERVHKLRLAELQHALTRASELPWVDDGRLVVIGSSEGSVPIGRLPGLPTLARIIYSWSCEANYFVESPGLALPTTAPTLTIISSRDPYFSAHNPWNKDYPVTGSCANALENHESATSVVLSSDKHTILGFPATRDLTKAFLHRILKL